MFHSFRCSIHPIKFIDSFVRGTAFIKFIAGKFMAFYVIVVMFFFLPFLGNVNLLIFI